MAGKRLGFEDTRGTLFFEVARLLKAKRPAFFLLENVVGLLSHDAGRTLETIFYKMAGNSVTVPVIAAIGERIRAVNEKYQIVR